MVTDRQMDASYREELLTRQEALQHECSKLLQELPLVEWLRQAGDVTIHGSYVTGLMVWRDLDIGVTAPNLSRAAAFASMLPLLTHPQVRRVRYLHQVGPLNPTSEPENDRYFFATYYGTETGDEWKIDVSLWVSPIPRQERLTPELITSRLTEEKRLTILWLKDLWHLRPEYMVEMGSPDIYDAVLDAGVRTPEEFEAYLAARSPETQ
jgi:hypothetical protein